MTNIDPELLKKYFRRQCTPEEAKKVLAWFRTPEGMRYLEKHIDNYNEIIRDITKSDSGLGEPADSEEIYTGIQRRISEETGNRKTDRVHQLNINRHKNRGRFWLNAAAVVLVMVFAAATYWSIEPWGAVEQSNESMAIVYATEHEQHKLLTLTDGTTVRLNENSSLTITEDYNRDTRRVKLNGEAFFDVSNNPELPFEVVADIGFISVIGTQFNVKIDNSRNVQVAVLEGKVAFSGEEYEGSSAILTKGYFGVYDFGSHETTIEESPVQNYISWINGTLVFDDAQLWKISRQLRWLYGTSFQFEDEEIRDLRLYASFPKDDVEEVLSIIASTLEIDYKLEANEVKWIWSNSNQ